MWVRNNETGPHPLNPKSKGKTDRRVCTYIYIYIYMYIHIHIHVILNYKLNSLKARTQNADPIRSKYAGLVFAFSPPGAATGPAGLSSAAQSESCLRSSGIPN